MKEPYASVTVLPLVEQAFLYEHTRDGLAALLANPEVTNVIEIGSWLGGSAKFIGNLLKERGGKLTCVDPWVGYDQLLREQDRFKTLYQQFLSNVIHWGLQDVIVPVRMKSADAARQVEEVADLIYVDGYHSRAEVFTDIVMWWPHLRSGGVMCGDDYTWDNIPEGIGDACHVLGLQYPKHTIGYWEMYPKKEALCLSGVDDPTRRYQRTSQS